MMTGIRSDEFVINVDDNDIDTNSPFYLCNNSHYYTVQQLPNIHQSINYKFSLIALSETWLESAPHSYYSLPGYELIVIIIDRVQRLGVELLSMFIVI